MATNVEMSPRRVKIEDLSRPFPQVCFLINMVHWIALAGIHKMVLWSTCLNLLCFLKYCLVSQHVAFLASVAPTWPLLKDALHPPPLASLIKGRRVNTYICSSVVSSGFTAGFIMNHLCGWNGCLNIRSILGPVSNRQALSIPCIFRTPELKIGRSLSSDQRVLNFCTGNLSLALFLLQLYRSRGGEWTASPETQPRDKDQKCRSNPGQCKGKARALQPGRSQNTRVQNIHPPTLNQNIGS